MIRPTPPTSPPDQPSAFRRVEGTGEASGRVPAAPGSCPTGDAPAGSSSQSDRDPSRGRVAVIDSGWSLAAAAILAASSAMEDDLLPHGLYRPRRRESVTLSPGAVAILRRKAEICKEERRRRQRSSEEMNERLLRQRIAEGRDDRADKYLHASARRRRAAASAGEAGTAEIEGLGSRARDGVAGTPAPHPTPTPRPRSPDETAGPSPVRMEN